MKKVLALRRYPLRMINHAPEESYEIMLLRKTPKQPEAAPTSGDEYVQTYGTIVTAVTPGLAVYEAFYEYLVWAVVWKWQLRERSLTRHELIEVEIVARDLADSAISQLGTPDERISVLIAPWRKAPPAPLSKMLC